MRCASSAQASAHLPHSAQRGPPGARGRARQSHPVPPVAYPSTRPPPADAPRRQRHLPLPLPTGRTWVGHRAGGLTTVEE